VEIILQHFSISGDGCKDIIKIMGYPAGENTDGFEPLSL
jgi:hypothetical protein